MRTTIECEVVYKGIDFTAIANMNSGTRGGFIKGVRVYKGLFFLFFLRLLECEFDARFGYLKIRRLGELGQDIIVFLGHFGYRGEIVLR